MVFFYVRGRHSVYGDGLCKGDVASVIWRLSMKGGGGLSKVEMVCLKWRWSV